VLSARRTALIEFVDPSLHSQSKILYPDFCLALKRTREMSPEMLYQIYFIIETYYHKGYLIRVETSIKIRLDIRGLQL